jgi:predicted DCC family thiol-disulfide oxidoreductase YuxK
MTFPDKPLILFDGVCNLCNGSIQFVIKHDKESKFLFASLQSEKGQEILKHLGLKTDNFDSFILLDKGEIYTKSSGVLKEAAILGGWFKIFTIFYLVPTFIRDLFYSFVAKNRYRFFGKKDACMIPTPELKARFLQ